MCYIINLFHRSDLLATYRLPCSRADAMIFAKAAAEQLGADEIDLIPAIF